MGHDSRASARGRSRRFAPTTSAVSCARRSCSMRASSSRQGTIDAAAAARGRGRRDPRHRQVPGGPRAAGHHRRRVSPHLLPHRFPDAAARRRDPRRHRRQLSQRRGQRRLRAAGDAGHGQGAITRSRSSCDDFEFLKSVTTRTPKVTIPSPTMLHFRGGRGAISTEAYPDLEAFYDDVAARLSRRDSPTSAKPAARYVQLDDTNLAYLCDDEDARRRACARRRSERVAAPLRQAHQRRDRRPAGRHDGLRPPVPRQLQERVGRRGRLRAGRRSAVQRARRRRLFPRVRRRALGRFRAVAPRAEGQDGRARPRQHQGRPARVEGRSEAPHRRGGASSCRSSSCACRRSADSRAPCTATTSPWSRRRPSCGSSSRRRATSGAASRCQASEAVSGLHERCSFQ